jgi:hypothetical protein
MAVGTTFNSNLDRNLVIEKAYKKLRVQDPTPAQMISAINSINLIIRELDPIGNVLHALSTDPSTITLVANQFIYTIASDSLQSNIFRLESVVYRDPTGYDTPMELMTPEGYEKIRDKFEVGNPKMAYLTEDRDFSARQLFISPALGSVNTQSELIGTDTLNYRCIRNVVGASTNRPITGANYKLFWEQAGSSGVAYVEGTQYYAPQLLRYIYRKPLFDFDKSGDNPDIPQSHVRSLIYRLALDLLAEIPKDQLSAEDVLELRKEAGNANRNIASTGVYHTDDHHNKGVFF